MKYAERILFIFISLLSCGLVSCEKEEMTELEENRKTLFMYMPWASDLIGNFYTNLSDMEESIASTGLSGEKVVVFLPTSPTEATLFEFTCRNGVCRRETLKEYIDLPFTTAEGITAILNDVKAAAPAEVYAMVIGCHGMGWLPVRNEKVRSSGGWKTHWEYEGVPKTRYFGGTTAEYQTEIRDLADGIAGAGLKMEYILFDDCYMSSIEVAYELKDVTDYLIGSTSEIMAYGMPYARIGQYLRGATDYRAVCDGFYDFYSTYTTPCGTLAVTDCSELERLAALMKEINSRYAFDTSLRGSLQRLDGYTPVIFYDYGDYVAHLCTDASLLEAFREQLSRTVPYKVHTETFYSMKAGEVPIKTFSGITTSDPSTHAWTASKTETGWYRATH